MTYTDNVIKIASLNDAEPHVTAHYHMYCDDDMIVPFAVDAQGQSMRSSFPPISLIENSYK